MNKIHCPIEPAIRVYNTNSNCPDYDYQMLLCYTSNIGQSKAVRNGWNRKLLIQIWLIFIDKYQVVDCYDEIFYGARDTSFKIH